MIIFFSFSLIIFFFKDGMAMKETKGQLDIEAAKQIFEQLYNEMKAKRAS